MLSRSFLASAGERTGVAPFVTTCFGPRTARGGVYREDLADDEPVAEHADRGQVLLHRGGRPGVGPDVGGHVERRDVAQPEPSRLAPPPRGIARRPARTPPASSRSRSAPRRTPGTAPPPTAPRRRSPAAGRSPLPRSSRPPAPPPPAPEPPSSFPSPPLPRRLNDRRAPRTARNRFRAPARARRAAPRRPPPRRTAPRSGREQRTPPRAGSPASRAGSRPAP